MDKHVNMINKSSLDLDILAAVTKSNVCVFLMEVGGGRGACWVSQV